VAVRQVRPEGRAFTVNPRIFAAGTDTALNGALNTNRIDRAFRPTRHVYSFTSLNGLDSDASAAPVAPDDEPSGYHTARTVGLFAMASVIVKRSVTVDT
jgi:hypothetical protein